MNIIKESRETAEAIRKFWKSDKHWQMMANYHYNDFMKHASETFEISADDFLNRIQQTGLTELLMEALLETFIETFYDDTNVINDYLKRRKWKHSKTAVANLEQLRDRFFSIYEVTKVNPGVSITVKDYFFKTKTVEVLEKSGSTCVQAGELIVAKVIEINDKYFFSGCLLKTNPEFALHIKDKLKENLKAEKISITQFKNYNIIPVDLCLKIKPLIEVYTFTMFTTALSLILPAKLLNNEGEELRMTHINFKMKDKNIVLKALSHEKFFDKHENDLYIWYEAVSKMERRILAEIRINKYKIKCVTNSESRAKKLISLLQDLALDGLGLPVIEYEDIYSQENSKKVKTQPDKIPEDVKKEIIEKYLHEHLKSSLDIKIPALKNKTPRECAKNNKRLLIGWLFMMEESINKQIPGGGYDISWAYEELGLKKNK